MMYCWLANQIWLGLLGPNSRDVFQSFITIVHFKSRHKKEFFRFVSYVVLARPVFFAKTENRADN